MKNIAYVGQRVVNFRLYESAWVQVEGLEHPAQVHKDRSNPAAFDVAGFKYDIDARALFPGDGAPRLMSLLSLKAVRDASLQGEYRPNGNYGN